MPRANRLKLHGQVVHVTHRCHDGAFLFRFRKDRDRYQALLREGCKEFDVSILSYCVTCNHAHLLLNPPSSGALGQFMQRVEGAIGQAYNQRKSRRGAFWSDRYHATLVETGHHLWSCLRYIDLNMVRAGVVSHPGQWPWTAWTELMGFRRRYRLIDCAALFKATGVLDWDAFRAHYRQIIDDAIRVRLVRREPWWTEATAVGGRDFVAAAEAALLNDGRRRRFTREPAPDDLTVLRELPIAYGRFSGPKRASKAEFQFNKRCY